MRVNSMDWTEQDIDALKALLAEGLTSSVIAERMGRTRSAICGKVGRLRQAGGVARPAQRPPAVRKASPTRLAKPAPRKPIAEPIAEGALGAPEEMIGRTGCNWIYGDPLLPGWRMCGHPGYPWCAAHASKVFIPKHDEKA